MAEPNSPDPGISQSDSLARTPIPSTGDATAALRDLISKPPMAPPQEYVTVNGIKYIREGTNLPTFGTQAGEYQDSAFGPKPIKITFNDSPTTFVVQKEILIQLIGQEEAEVIYQDHMHGGGKQVCLDNASPSAISTLIQLLQAPLEHSSFTLSAQPVADVLELYVTAGRYGHHEWIRKACLEATSWIDVGIGELLRLFQPIYEQGRADTGLRKCLKDKIGLQLDLLSLGEVTNGPVHRKDIIRASRVGGDFAEDIISVFLGVRPNDQTLRGWQPGLSGPIPAFGNIQGGVAQHALPQIPMRQPRAPNADTNWLTGPLHGYQMNDNLAVDGDLTPRPRPRPRSGWAETAPSSELGDNDIENMVNEFDNIDWGFGGNPVGDAEDSMSDGGTKLGPDTNWIDADTWPHNGPTATGIEKVRSFSEIANDGWSFNPHGKDDSWDAAATEYGGVPPRAPPVQLESSNFKFGAAFCGAGAAPGHDLPAYPQLPANAPTYPQLPARFPTSLPSYRSGRRQVLPPGASFKPDHPGPSAAIVNDPVAASRHQRELNPPPFPMAPPSVFPHPGEGPIGMPHYMPYLGYNRLVSVGNGMVHTTSPGMYGLAGRTVVATQNSGFDCSLYFRAGDIISNAVALFSRGAPPYQPPSATTGPGVITHMQGICRGRAGQFPTSYIREMNPSVFRNLGTPFNPIPTPARHVPTVSKQAPVPAPAQNTVMHSSWPTDLQAKKVDCGNWGCNQEECNDCKGDEIIVSRGARPDLNMAGRVQLETDAWENTTTDDEDEASKHVTWGENATRWHTSSQDW